MNYRKLLWLLPLLTVLFTGTLSAQEEPVPEEVVRLKYFNDDNSIQYLLVESLLKTGRKYDPLGNKSLKVYMDSKDDDHLIGRVTTDKNGLAKCFLPPSLQEDWDAASMHTFIAVPDADAEEPSTELEITKARISIDTLYDEGTRSISVKVERYADNEWKPADEVEMQVGVRRLNSLLSAGADATYYTDTSGIVTVEFNKENLPGDQQGNIVLVARVNNNDLFGNLKVSETVPWGVAVKSDNNHFFEQRTLWSTRFRTPLWLLFMAYSIVIAVWGTLIYLVFQIVKIKKLGTEASAS